ncbi:hypothetical protein EVAR_82838_1 [Eumeta japonica]|uniref:Uncharacterized protein n=1 Tax=Eumeta variegata TaxID=151549 RepID=A0A4C1V383_EUMVA|nr:hypothetical protein EVAR_82838_1 [Eumeta japonica]
MQIVIGESYNRSRFFCLATSFRRLPGEWFTLSSRACAQNTKSDLNHAVCHRCSFLRVANPDRMCRLLKMALAYLVGGGGAAVERARRCMQRARFRRDAPAESTTGRSVEPSKGISRRCEQLRTYYIVSRDVVKEFITQAVSFHGDRSFVPCENTLRSVRANTHVLIQWLEEIIENGIRIEVEYRVAIGIKFRMERNASGVNIGTDSGAEIRIKSRMESEPRSESGPALTVGQRSESSPE